MTEYKNKRHLWSICPIGNPIADSKEAVKESFELVDASLLFLSTDVTVAETRYRCISL